MRLKTVLAYASALLIALNIVAIPAQAANASEGFNLQISPLPISLVTKPGTSVSTDLRIRNAGAMKDMYQVKLLKVTEDDNGEVHLTSPKSTDEWVEWVRFSKTTFEAPPGEWITIKMTITVPKTAAFGYYFAVEYSRANPALPEAGKAVTQGAAATFILLNADAPGAKREAKIVSFNASRKSYEFLPAAFRVKIRATGNVHVAPHGNIFILKGKKQIATIDINAAEGSVLPNSSRFFDASWEEGFPAYIPATKGDQPVVDKNGKTVYKLSWDFAHINRLRFGKYTAKLVMVYDDGQRDVPLEATVTFWVMPWRIIGGVTVFALLIVTLIVYVFVLRSRLKHVRSGFRFSQRK